jgi:hypothetical protein
MSELLPNSLADTVRDQLEHKLHPHNHLRDSRLADQRVRESQTPRRRAHRTVQAAKLYFSR